MATAWTHDRFLPMYEYAGNAHIHTPYSDGSKWHADVAADAIKAGLDFIIVTDHNIWVDGVEGYYENELGRVLLLVGEEIHDARRQPQASHFLAYGAEKELSLYAQEPQRLVDETNRAGGFGFLAHPFDPVAPFLRENGQALGWHDWSVEGYVGLEIWNFMSSFKGLLTSKVMALRAALNPEKYIVGPQPESLAKWDELLSQGKRVAAVGNSDAHGFTYSMGPITRVIFPYDFLFRAVNTHVLVPSELSGDLEHDKRLILRAIREGNSWVGYDLPHSTQGFRFTGQGRNKGIMGDMIKLDTGATLQARAPLRCHMFLMRNGEIVAKVDNDTNLTHIPMESGAYRVECAIDHLGMKRSWIFSNPIYLE